MVHQFASVRVRNLVDVLMKKLIVTIGNESFFAVTVACIVLAIILLRPKRDFMIFHGWYFVALLLESMGLAFLYIFMMNQCGEYLFSADDAVHYGWPGIVLSLGAGVYEELLFRAILFGGGIILLKNVLHVNRFVSYLIAVVISSTIFALIHYWGNGGDDFSLYSFWFRFAGGIFFCSVFYLRGFAAVVYTHALYDIIVAAAIGL